MNRVATLGARIAGNAVALVNFLYRTRQIDAIHQHDLHFDGLVPDDIANQRGQLGAQLRIGASRLVFPAKEPERPRGEYGRNAISFGKGYLELDRIVAASTCAEQSAERRFGPTKPDIGSAGMSNAEGGKRHQRKRMPRVWRGRKNRIIELSLPPHVIGIGGARQRIGKDREFAVRVLDVAAHVGMPDSDRAAGQCFRRLEGVSRVGDDGEYVADLEILLRRVDGLYPQAADVGVPVGCHAFNIGRHLMMGAPFHKKANRQGRGNAPREQADASEDSHRASPPAMIGSVCSDNDIGQFRRSIMDSGFFNNILKPENNLKVCIAGLIPIYSNSTARAGVSRTGR